MEQEIKEIPCREIHKIDGVVPAITDLHFDQRVCDCQRLFFYKEQCTCPTNPHFDLKSKPNPNYIPQ